MGLVSRTSNRGIVSRTSDRGLVSRTSVRGLIPQTLDRVLVSRTSNSHISFALNLNKISISYLDFGNKASIQGLEEISIMSHMPSCHEDERSALLQLKESFIIIKSTSGSDSAYPKVLQWKSEGESTNCCSWDGILCDEETGHIRYLNLSGYVILGQIPSQISSLSKFSSLDLSFNLDVLTGTSLLALKNPNFETLVRNLTKLEKLHLSFVNITSTIVDSLANFSSLTSLKLESCELLGDFPARIFQLPNLHSLSVRENPDLYGFLPEFSKISSLMWLRLATTNFSGKLPSSIEKIHLLRELDVSECYFLGPIPSSIGKLRLLQYLDLSYNYLVGQIPESMAYRTQLTYLSLSFKGFSGGNLYWVGKQSRLTFLDLASVNLTGEMSGPV
nr:receptor-like protein 7 [Ziziphus jujuba var. spinosa]